MTKNYIQKNISASMMPKKATLRFLLDYSKSFRVVQTKTNKTIELHLN